jgi:hypothetical protein
VAARDHALAAGTATDRPWEARRVALLLFGIAAGLVIAAYGGVLDNYFNEIDDALSLNGAVEGVYSARPRFLPVHFGWIRLLHALFGADPRGYYVGGLLLHVLSATTLGLIVRRLTGRVLPAAIALAAFSVFYAPIEVVMWITASCGLLSVLFVLVATLAWDHFLVEGARRWFWIATASAMLAMGSKEDSVMLAPLLLGLDRIRNGRAWGHGFVRRYAGFAALGAVYLAIALRPVNWPGSQHGGRYDLRLELVPKLIANLAILFWPRSFDPDRGWTLALLGGIAILVSLGALTWRWRKTSPLVGWGLLVCVFGLLPVLPGAYPVIAQQRFAYPSAIGVALIAGGLATALQDAVLPLGADGTRRLAVAALAVFATWIAVQVVSVRSAEQWRFERHCTHFRNAMRSSEIAFAGASSRTGAPRSAVVLGPDIWDPEDYVAGLHAIVGLPKECVSIRYLSIEDVLRKIDEEAWLATSATSVYVGDPDGSISPVRRREDLPLQLWARIATDYSTRGFGRTIALVSIEEARGRG